MAGYVAVEFYSWGDHNTAKYQLEEPILINYGYRCLDKYLPDRHVSSIHSPEGCFGTKFRVLVLQRNPSPVPSIQMYDAWTASSGWGRLRYFLSRDLSSAAFGESFNMVRDIVVLQRERAIPDKDRNKNLYKSIKRDSRLMIPCRDRKGEEPSIFALPSPSPLHWSFFSQFLTSESPKGQSHRVDPSRVFVVILPSETTSDSSSTRSNAVKKA